jgi:hypothetical protein
MIPQRGSLMPTRYLPTAFVIAAFAGGCTVGSATSPTPSAPSSVRQSQTAAVGVPFPPVGGMLTVGGDVAFSGGTGRFTHASGKGLFAGTVNTALQTGVNAWTGTIRYDASDRSSS